MKPRRLSWAHCLVVLSAGCGPGPEIATATFALGEVPESVESISVFVREVGRSEIVASSTLSAPQQTLSLGVPAEVPLQMTAVARSDRPAPLDLGGHMPIYVARTVRSVPLGNQPTQVQLNARPGGALTVLIDGLDEGGDVGLSLSSAAETLPLQSRLPIRGARLMRVLSEGRWQAQLADERWTLEGAQGLWAAPAFDTFARLRLRRASPVPGPEAPQALRITVLDEQDGPVLGPVQTSTLSPRRLKILIRAYDAAGAQVSVPPAEVQLQAQSVPQGLHSELPALGLGLPAEVTAWQVMGEGRVRLTARATFDSGRVLQASWHSNVGRAGRAPTRLTMQMHDPMNLVEGTHLRAVLLDEGGRLAAVGPWNLALEGSDPWAYFPDGLQAVVTGAVAEVPMARPSGPRGLSVVVRAVATSTTFRGTFTSTLTLPVGPLEAGELGGG